MISCIFSSTHGGSALRKAILEELDKLLKEPSSSKICIYIFAFSLTDEEIANKLILIASGNQLVTINIIADWSQRGIKGKKQLYNITQLNLSNISIKFKLDQPYLPEIESTRVKWNYKKSSGLLHHKSLLVKIDDKYKYLIIGSFNWTKRASNYYENLIILKPDSEAILNAIHKFQLEFDFMWNNSNLTASINDSNLYFDRIKSQLILNKFENHFFNEIITDYSDDNINFLSSNQDVLIAFNSKGINQLESERGYHPINKIDRFQHTKINGIVKSVPLNITNLSLEIIYKAKAGDELKMASYALSTKTVEFGALIEAARRNVRVYLLLDYKINHKLIQYINSKYSSLPIEIRTTSKRLHSKYIIHVESNSVLSGTANFTRDASFRHTEHRLLIQGNELVTRAFVADFKTIWERVKKREKDKPRLFLSNNGNDALDKPYHKYMLLFNKNKYFIDFFLNWHHNFLFLQLNLLQLRKKSENKSISELFELIQIKASLLSFRVFLIGSFIDTLNNYKLNHTSDIDIFVCPESSFQPSINQIEVILIWIKKIGITNKVIFDIKYSSYEPKTTDIELFPKDLISFTKLYSPYLKQKIKTGKLLNYKFIGRYLIHFELEARKTNFYEKLPQNETKKKFLRGAVDFKKIISRDNI